MIPSNVRQAIRDMIDDCSQTDYDDDQAIDLNAVEEWLDNLPEPPRPDWSKAPEWANWWAVDADGEIGWHEFKPEPTIKVWTNWDSQVGQGRKGYGKFIDIPIGIDWRELCEERPKEVGGE